MNFQSHERQTLILLTTAITRGKLHKKSIGLFYEKLYDCFIDNYNIIHIINIDYPLKLRNKNNSSSLEESEIEEECEFNPTETREILDEIIPNDIKKIFIIKDDNNPSFAKAYKKVINCIYENDLLVLYNNPILWWLEDDWTMRNFYDFSQLFRLIDTTNINDKTALSITDNAPLCSFRAGPIMSSLFFETYFDISSSLDDIKDPEYRVGKNIKCNESVKVYDNDILIICVFVYSQIKPPYNMKSSCYWWYEERMKTMRFKHKHGITYIMAVVQEHNSEKIHYKISKNANELELNCIDKYKKNGFVKCTISQFNKLKEDSALNYITIVPPIFEDIGREFNSKYLLNNKKNDDIC